MNRQAKEIDGGGLGRDRSGTMVRAVYYAVIVGLGLLLFMTIYLAR